jgi:hypothetical protein
LSGNVLVDPELPQRLASEISDDEYEKKIAGLLARRFAADVASDPALEAQWQQGADVLRQGDHYMLVMLDAAIGRHLKRRWQFWR